MGTIYKTISCGIIVFLCAGTLFAQQPKPQVLQYNLQKIKDVHCRLSAAKPYCIHRPVISPAYHAKTLFISAPLPVSAPSAAPNAPDAASMAFQFLNSIADQLEINDAYQSFNETTGFSDNLGFAHVKMQETYQGIPVFGCEAIVHLKSGANASVNGKCIPLALFANVNTNPAVADTMAQNIAVQDVRSQTKWADLSADARKILNYTGPVKELVIYPDINDDSKLNLAWHFTIRPNALQRYEYFVDANTGAILLQYDNTCTDGPATGQGTDLNSVSHSLNLYLLNGTYYMVDASKSMFNAGASRMPDNPVGGIRTVNANNTDMTAISDMTSGSATSWTDASSVSAQYQAGIAYDYYKNTFGRIGLDGQGGTMLSVVNVTNGGAAMDNAYWNGQLMAYGNGAVLFKPLAGALDVTAHEMTHGVIQSTANLTYLNQSGAVNESFADVFATMVDRSNWTIGEQVVNNPTYFPNGALRDLSNPHNGGRSDADICWQPAKMSEFVNLPTTTDHGGVHINSGIPNHAFYLIATGTSKDSAEQVYYRTLTVYLTASSQFIDLRLAVIQAASDMYGDSSHFVKVAKSAFDAVQIFDGAGNNFTADENPVYGSDMILAYKTGFAKKDTAIYLVNPQPSSYKDYYGIILNQAIHKPSVTDDGQRGYFIGTDNNIYKLAIDTTKFKEFTIGFTGYYWNNIAVSRDSTRLALTRNPNDTCIYVLDIRNPNKVTYVKYKLYDPTYAAGINSGTPYYANTLEWDPSGQFVMYDSYNNNAGNNYWDVGFLKGWDTASNTYGDGTITKLFADIPVGVDITNPTYSKNSPYIIAYDYHDANTGTYQIKTGNIEHGFDSVVYTNNTLGYPTFSKNDNILAFTSIASDKDTIVAEIPLNKDKMTASGQASTLLTGFKWPVWYTRGLRSGVSSMLNTTENLLCELNDIKFYSASLGKITSYSWNFGVNASPQVSTGPGPVIVDYARPGIQTVTLTVEDSAGDKSTVTSSIFVYAAAVLSITEGANNKLTMHSTIGVTNIQWLLNGQPISGATASTYTASHSGNYTVEAKAGTGCISTSPEYGFINSGIDTQNPIGSLEIYPNPTNGTFNLQFESGTADRINLNVFDLLGNNVYGENIEGGPGAINKQLNLSRFPAGIYLLQLNAGDQLYTERIVIQK